MRTSAAVGSKSTTTPKQASGPKQAARARPSRIKFPTDAEYNAFRAAIADKFGSVSAAVGDGPFFHTAAGRVPGDPRVTLFDLFLSKLPAGVRQHYNCRTCRKFVETYGDLVYVRDDGVTRSLFWDASEGAGVPMPFREAVAAMEKLVHNAPISGAALFEDGMWGTNSTKKAHTCGVVGGHEATNGRGRPRGSAQCDACQGDMWHHMSVVPKRPFRPDHLQTTSQVIAERKQGLHRHGEGWVRLRRARRHHLAAPRRAVLRHSHRSPTGLVLRAKQE